MLGGPHPDSSRSSGLGHHDAHKGIMTTDRSSVSATSGKPDRPEHRGAQSRDSRDSSKGPRPVRIDSTAQNSVDPKRAEERSERARVKEAEELAYALKSRGGAQKAFGGSEPMRLSVAHNLQPQLAKARSEAEKLRQEKALLLRHNRHLLLEINRLQTVAAIAATEQSTSIVPAAASGATSGALHQAAANAGNTADVLARREHDSLSSTADLLAWPPSGGELVQLRSRYDELRNEYRAQRKELLSAHKLCRELQDRAKQVEEQAMAVNSLRDELMPLIAACKKEAAVLNGDRTRDLPAMLLLLPPCYRRATAVLPPCYRHAATTHLLISRVRV